MTTSTQFAARVPLARLGFAALLSSLLACGGSENLPPTTGSGSSLSLLEVSHGFGQVLPHTVFIPDAVGMPSTQLVSVRTYADLLNNLRPTNPIQPVPPFKAEAVLPNGAPGNHFLYARFSQPLDLSSVFDLGGGGVSTGGLAGPVLVTAIDPISGDSTAIPGRAFVNGMTVSGSPGSIELERWVEVDSSGQTVALRPEGMGFPGTESSFSGSADLIGPDVLVFIPDDGDGLALHDTFPEGVQIRMAMGTALRAQNGKFLEQRALACATVGADDITPEVLSTPPPLNSPLITPGNGDVDVDPLTNIRVEFTEPVQPLTVGDLDDGTPPGLASSMILSFGPPTARTDMPFSVRPVSVFDLSVYELIPAYNFPGAGPRFAACGTFSQVDIVLNSGQIQDLASQPNPADPLNPKGNVNLLAAGTKFHTGEGPGVVNAPVAPDTILIGRSGAVPGISVLDLNGFGQSTGNPSQVPGQVIKGYTNFVNNENLRNPGLLPPLAEGTCTIDGGSAGVFTLTLDSNLEDLVVRPPLMSDNADIAVGHPLDITFNNADSAFGCQSGTGSVCAKPGFKQIQAVVGGPNTVAPPQVNQFGSSDVGGGNVISWAPHPNPPPLSFPPLCVSPFLWGAEPTSVDHFLGPQIGNNNNPARNNLLIPGNPFGQPLADPPKPPQGLLTAEQNSFFLGPSQGQTDGANCNLYQLRQQIGQYVYVVDRQRREVVVLNSNRMTVIERIPMADPTSLAMGANLDLLAVTNQSADTVTFLDVDPNSSTFHQVIQNTVVGSGPRGIAWQPGNEDILVCNELDNTLSIISAFSLQVRRIVGAQLDGPFEVCAFPRMTGFAFNRQVYFAYVLNRSGRVAMFESGPNGTNGWGYDDIVGIAPFTFQNPKTLQPDPLSLQAGAWIVHEGAIDPFTGQASGPGVGAVSRLFIESSNTGPLTLVAGSNPQFRSVQLAVQVSVGGDQLSGVPVDLAFDNQLNYGALPNVATTFSAGAPSISNGKGLIRSAPLFGAPRNASEPSYLFVAIPNAAGGSGVIDVFGLQTSGVQRADTDAFVVGTQSIPAPNVTLLADYWRQ